jgi:hypothetical protein
LSHTTPSEILQQEINSFFDSFHNNSTSIEEASTVNQPYFQIKQPALTVGRDSAPISTTPTVNDPSERTINQSSTQFFQPVSARTRSQTSNPIQANSAQINRRKYRKSRKRNRNKKRKSHSKANIFGLNASVSVQQVQSAILSNNQYLLIGQRD